MPKPNARFDPERAFEHARAFEEACDALSVYMSRAKRSGMVAPIATLQAFSTEVYLKCLLALEGRPVPSGRDGHDLERLFAGLSDAARLGIERRFNGRITNHPTAVALKAHLPFLELSLSPILENAKNAFDGWRYVYERDEDDSGPANMNTVGLQDFLISVKEQVLERRPDWR